MKKRYLILLLIAFTFFSVPFLASCSREETAKETEKDNDKGNIVSVYNCGEYIDPETVKLFEKETGIKVRYDTYASNEDLYVKLKQNTDNYDVVVPSDYMIERMIRENMLAKIDYKNIPNFKEVDDKLKNPSFDPQNQYTVPYFWGTVGIVYNQKMIKDKIDSWSDLWNPKYKNQIIMYNSQRDSIAVALKKLGYSLNTVNPKELEEAKEELIKQKPLVYAYLTDDGRDVIVQGDAAIAVEYSGDAELMMSENKDLRYVIPKEGSNIWYDCFVIPKTAKHKKAGEEFINFMCRPDIAEMNAEYCMGYTSPIVKVKELLPEELSKSEVAYPDLSKLPPLEPYKDLGKDVNLYDKIWTEVIATM